MPKTDPKSWSGAQFKAARVWVGLTHEELASEASVGLATVRRVEVSTCVSRFRRKTIRKIQNTLEDYSAIFSVPENYLILAEPDFDESEIDQVDEQLNYSHGYRSRMETAVGI